MSGNARVKAWAFLFALWDGLCKGLYNEQEESAHAFIFYTHQKFLNQ